MAAGRQMTYYKATFSDGTVLRRSTASRKYTHAWLAYGENLLHSNPHLKTWRASGFSGAEHLARKQAAGPWGFNRTIVFAAVTPTVEITAQEYRALGRGGDG